MKVMCINVYDLHIPGRPIDERFAICDGFSRYMASNYGFIYDTVNQCLLSQHEHHTDGRSSVYLRVNVIRDDGVKRDVGVNRLVLMAWKPLENYNDVEANHIDRNTLNNCLYNLEWLNHLDNVQHYYKSIDAPIIYTDDIVNKICYGIERSMPYQQICEQLLNVQYSEQLKSYITAVRKGLIRTDISSQYNFPKKRRNTAIFDDDQIAFICECIINGDSSDIILEKLNINYPKGSKERLNVLEIIRRIRSKERFTRISDNYF